MIHELKCDPKYFKEITEGQKTFEYRRKDRDFQVGDFLALNEYSDYVGYCGGSCIVEVTYIFDDRDYVTKDYVVMSIRPCCIGRVMDIQMRDIDSLIKVPVYNRPENSEDNKN